MAKKEIPVRRSHRVVVRSWGGIRPGSAANDYGYPGKFSARISQEEIQEITQSGQLFRNFRGGRENVDAFDEQAALADQSYERELLADLVGWVDGPHPVSSTWCAEVGYFVARGERGIAIRFKDGAVCFYANTSTVLYDALLNAGSKGKFVHEFVAHRPYILVS